jgi:rhodanese-related sulfurtransferase/DNA-binding transcriptional ArsR family regulator
MPATSNRNWDLTYQITTFLTEISYSTYNSSILLNTEIHSTSVKEKHQSKDQLYQLFARLGSALANPHRLELLDLLVQAPRTVEDLAQEAHMSVANTSQHLQRLKLANLVSDERQGLFVRYRLADPAVARLWLELRSVAELQLAEVDRALSDYRPRHYDFQIISVENLQERINREEVLLLDVRPEVEFQAGHLPSAVSIPLDELEQRLEELPPGNLIIAYCRGPYCVFADQALELLSSRGWNVVRLEEGVAEWQFAGNLLEK